jgi:hypothetical protein
MVRSDGGAEDLKISNDGILPIEMCRNGLIKSYEHPQTCLRTRVIATVHWRIGGRAIAFARIRVLQKSETNTRGGRSLEQLVGH